MIRVVISRTADGIVAFDADGHAGAAPRGQDIVCAGVASLTQTAVIGLERFLHREMKLDVASGRLRMELAAAPDVETQAILETMLLGLREIAALHPRQLVIHEHRR